MIPQNYVSVDSEEARKQLTRLLDTLDENDDVQAVYSNLEESEPPKHDRVLQLVRDFAKEKEEWIGSAAELLEELKTRSANLDLTANVLIRIMNANSTMLRNFYKVAYQILPKRNNMKRISLRFLFEVVVENIVVTDPSDTSDISDNTGHIALIGLSGQ